MFSKLYSFDIVSELQKDNPDIFLDLYNDLEATKKKITLETKQSITFNINQKVLQKLIKQNKGKPSTDIDFRIECDELVLESSLVLEQFNSVVRPIINSLVEVLKKKEAMNVNTILLVGGFGKSDLIQNEMKTKFPDHRLVIPEEAGIAVLKGAVLYGHDPSIISSRVTRFTYGVSGIVPFEQGKHSETKKIKRDDKDYCIEVFTPIQAKNESVLRGTYVRKAYPVENSYNLKVSIYASTEEFPMYVDDESCKKVGTIEMELPPTSDPIKFVDIEFCFSDTEITVKAHDEKRRCKVETQWAHE